MLQSSAGSLTALDARLHSLSPLAVLNRGYALVLSQSGSLIRSAAQVASGDRLTTRLADGTFASRVESTNLLGGTSLSDSPSAPTPAEKGKKQPS
jgi:exodeoxyribonuclease VII large subunit